MWKQRRRIIHNNCQGVFNTNMTEATRGLYMALLEVANIREHRRLLVHDKDQENFYATMHEAIIVPYAAVPRILQRK